MAPAAGSTMRKARRAHRPRRPEAPRSSGPPWPSRRTARAQRSPCVTTYNSVECCELLKCKESLLHCWRMQMRTHMRGNDVRLVHACRMLGAECSDQDP
eukprot:720401-Pleurochrysis_carterae.AAC.1